MVEVMAVESCFELADWALGGVVLVQWLGNFALAGETSTAIRM